MLHLKAHYDVPNYIEAAMRRLVDVIPEVTEIRHNVAIHLLPAAYWCDENNRQFVGTFFRPRNKRERVLIHVAGRAMQNIKRQGRNAERSWVAITLLHELAHYEQWRDGRKISERGVEKRARGLLAKCIESMDAE